MPLPKQYDPKEAEPRWQARWQADGRYHFDRQGAGPIYSIDTPPPTVSGHLHLGHVYSYSHADFIARFWRMQGRRVFYPMGFDDNGLPTERLVEKRQGITAGQVGRPAFIQACLQESEIAEQEYRQLWQRLGLSIDWRYTYRTIDDRSRRTSQQSFLDLYRQGLAYRRESPAIWCPECHTSIAQAELNDLERPSEFVTLPFFKQDGSMVEIATTRPELLPACVAVFIHPQDARYTGLAGQKLVTPLFGQEVPVLEDSAADPQKGTGVVMCCTFGDTTDVAWWFTYHLPLIQALDGNGRLTEVAGKFAGLSAAEGRTQIKAELERQGLLLARQPTTQSVRVHERCDTPVEYIVHNQWFVRVLDQKDKLLQAGAQVAWHPEHMHARYQAWVENLNWDWCISRQRYYGVPFPVWYCRACGELVLADEAQLPVDPTYSQPARPCHCGSTDFQPEEDVMDTWATSSLSPQIVGQWLDDPDLYRKVFPFSLRPQAHEIIRTWAFYTIVKSEAHFGERPWSDVLISGWGLAGEGMGKISKSRGGGPMAPMEMLQRYSADALRYWAASTGPGRDAIISEEKIQMGAKLVTKLWNVARFSERFIETRGERQKGKAINFSPADRWILARLARLIGRVTASFQEYDYAAAKTEIESFFWRDLADNYIEMAKQRLYDDGHPQQSGACYALTETLRALLKLFAPLLPFVTEEIYLELFAAGEGQASIHTSAWPQAGLGWENPPAEALGEILVEIATAVRRYKSERSLSLGSELAGLRLGSENSTLAAGLAAAEADLTSITRARSLAVEVIAAPPEAHPAGEAWLQIIPLA